MFLWGIVRSYGHFTERKRNIYGTERSYIPLFPVESTHFCAQLSVNTAHHLLQTGAKRWFYMPWSPRLSLTAVIDVDIQKDAE